MGVTTTGMVYDGDGVRVRRAVSGTNTFYVGNWYEKTGNGETKYYYYGGQLIALRRSGYAANNGLFYVHTDHLGSTTLTTDNTGAKVAEQRFYPFGATRYTYGTQETDFNFTGQRLDILDPTGNLLYYGSRYYDPLLRRFIQADSVVPGPGNPQTLNRYSYVVNNPLRFADPNGYMPSQCGGLGGECGGDQEQLPDAQQQQDSSGNPGNPTYPGEPEPRPRPIPPSPGSYRWWRSVGRAEGLVAQWETGIGPDISVFGPEDDLTRDVMYDPGMEQFYNAWSAAGYPVPWAFAGQADQREGAPDYELYWEGFKVFLHEHVYELPRAAYGLGSKTPQGRIDAVGGTIGSLDNIYVSDRGNGQVLITVQNEMGVSSLTRAPGHNWSGVQGWERSTFGPGGSTRQYFYWAEPRRPV
jgi:RHS repeat-associated protein